MLAHASISTCWRATGRVTNRLGAHVVIFIENDTVRLFLLFELVYNELEVGKIDEEWNLSLEDRVVVCIDHWVRHLLYHVKEKQAKEHAKSVEEKTDYGEQSQLCIVLAPDVVVIKFEDVEANLVSCPEDIIECDSHNVHRVHFFIELKQRLSFGHQIQLDEDEADHDRDAEPEEESQVRDSVVSLVTRCLHCVECSIDKMSNKDRHDYDLGGLEALPYGDYLVMSVLGKLSNLAKDGKNEGELQILINDDPMGQHFEECWNLADHDSVKFELPRSIGLYYKVLVGEEEVNS